MKSFIHRGDRNPHGWGIAYYPDDSKAAIVLKEPVKARMSIFPELLNMQKINSGIFIAHVRYTSVGERNLANTHPFSRCYKGKNFTFAHNGTLSGSYRYNLDYGPFEPLGETDSEHAFCYLLDKIQAGHLYSGIIPDFDKIFGLLRNINSYGNFNCLFSDGTYLYAYRDTNGYNGLCYTKRQYPFDSINLVDEDYAIDLSSEKARDEYGYVVATRPLSDENWVNLEPGTLVIFKKGIIEYSSGGNTPLDKIDLRILKLLRESDHRKSLTQIELNLGENSQVYKRICNLIYMGYVKQDSRDNIGQPASENTYYTIRSKRDEIDLLIKELSE